MCSWRAGDKINKSRLCRKSVADLELDLRTGFMSHIPYALGKLLELRYLDVNFNL